MSFNMNLHRSASGMIYNRVGGVDWPVCNPSQPTRPEPTPYSKGSGASDHPFAFILVIGLITGVAAGPQAGIAVVGGFVGLVIALAVVAGLIRFIGWAIGQILLAVLRIVTWPMRKLWRLMTR